MKGYTAQDYIKKLGLEPHKEGGYFKNTFHSSSYLSKESLPGAFNGERKLYTSIYFLLTSNDVSHFHRLKSDELWYFHAGSPLVIHIIDEEGNYIEKKLGLDLDNGEEPQVLVPKNCIFGSSVAAKDSFSLVGCMVAPGFAYEDFELFTQKELLDKYPQHEEIIVKLAYEKLPQAENR